MWVKFKAGRSVRDLGVEIDTLLTFSKHVDNIMRKQIKEFLLLEAFRTNNIKALLFAFKVCVLTILKYCSTIWSSFKLHDVDRIEKVQWRFTINLEDLINLTYAQCLEAWSRSHSLLQNCAQTNWSLFWWVFYPKKPIQHKDTCSNCLCFENLLDNNFSQQELFKLETIFQITLFQLPISFKQIVSICRLEQIFTMKLGGWSYNC